MRAIPAVLMILLAGCGSRGNYGCGIAAVAGQSMLLEEFGREGRVLTAVPGTLPEVLPVRMALGASYRALVGRSDTAKLVIGVEGELPPTPVAGYGVLVVDSANVAQGVILYEGRVIEGAPELGTVHAGDRTIPLIGLRTDLSGFQDASCPIFPDSLRR